jgi:hypothetical protein
MLLYEQLLSRLNQADDAMDRGRGQLPSAGTSKEAAKYVGNQLRIAIALLLSVANDVDPDTTESTESTVAGRDRKPAKPEKSSGGTARTAD